MIAQNAGPVIRARERGMKPAEMICISLVGTICTANHPTYADPAKEYDWRWVRDLDVCVWVGAAMDWVETVKAIALCKPEHLSIWNSYEHWGAQAFLRPTMADVEMCKPVSQWAYELDFLPWMDFQNDDFLIGRSYARTSTGMPYALDT
ncbi:hypothetical protein [Massilia sp. PWRC2]|uniref:hypothetical protein n=1 Tax=Massilia sp. PWRC2 TaxID=2804626 RepID=UPI003CE7C0CB